MGSLRDKEIPSGVTQYAGKALNLEQMIMQRRMTDVEKSRFRQYFPRLDVNSAVVTSEISTAYNCIAWTAGITDRWIWPGDSIESFDQFYGGLGFKRAADGEIAAWGISTSSMKHGSISGPGHGPRWESKIGSDLRIQHGLNELVSSSYGRVLSFYRKGPLPTIKVMRKKLVRRLYLSDAQKRRLHEERSKIPQNVRIAFDKLFAAWKKTWFSRGLATSSDPRTRAVGPEYDALVALGPVILPLVIERLAIPENFLTLQLYDAVQSNDRLIVQFEPGDERILEGEQGRAKRVVQAWFVNQ